MNASTFQLSDDAPTRYERYVAPVMESFVERTIRVALLVMSDSVRRSPGLPAFAKPDATRSRNMAAIRSSNTKPEREVRSLLHAAGFRFRVHARTLPGTPDIVLARFRLVVFVHGCYWHGHGCRRDHTSSTNRPYWTEKLARNQARDRRRRRELRTLGWRTRVIWECSARSSTDRLIRELRRMSVDGGTRLSE